jgi:perosamine synthetase
MIGLMPAENWEHRFVDLVRGLSTALEAKKQNAELSISGLGTCIPVRSGRAALVAAIRALNLPHRARLGVPLYCCPVVLKAIVEADCIPHFIDIDPETFCLSPEDLASKRSQIDAVIAIHMFGNLCDMTALQEAAQGKPIIEDCAQALGSKIADRIAGSFGTIAFFSFRSGKYLSVGEGGALFSTNAEIQTRLAALVSRMPAPSQTDELMHVVKTYIRSMLRSKPLYGLVGYRLWAAYNRMVDYSEKSTIVLSQIFRSDNVITNERLRRLHAIIKKQRANADFYSRTLQLDKKMLCSEKPGTFYNRYLFPIIFSSSEHRDFIAAYLHRQQIDTIQPYKEIADVAATYYGYNGDCPVAERIAKGVLVIPSYYNLKEKDVQRIAQCLNAGWKEIKLHNRQHDKA